MKISRRRVQQIWKHYIDTGSEPVLGIDLGRPRKPYDQEEVAIIKAAYMRYKFGVRMLEMVVRNVYKTRISHNRIHMYLKVEGLAGEDAKKKKRRKWVRYERKHSLSAGHIDWHEVDGSDTKVCVVWMMHPG